MGWKYFCSAVGAGGWVEEMHSGIIALLLSSHDEQRSIMRRSSWMNHGCGTLFLQEFLECAGKPEQEVIVWSQVTPHVEVSGGGIIDLLVDYETSSGARKSMVIENKAKSENPSSQLLGYRQKWTLGDVDEVLFVGLTPRRLNAYTIPEPLVNVTYLDFAPKVREHIQAVKPEFTRVLLQQWIDDVEEKMGPLRWYLGELGMPRKNIWQLCQAFNFFIDTRFSEKIEKSFAFHGGEMVTDKNCLSRKRARNWYLSIRVRGFESRAVGECKLYFYFILEPSYTGGWFKTEYISARIRLRVEKDPSKELLKQSSPDFRRV